ATETAEGFELSELQPRPTQKSTPAASAPRNRKLLAGTSIGPRLSACALIACGGVRAPGIAEVGNPALHGISPDIAGLAAGRNVGAGARTPGLICEELLGAGAVLER